MKVVFQKTKSQLIEENKFFPLKLFYGILQLLQGYAFQPCFWRLPVLPA